MMFGLLDRSQAKVPEVPLPAGAVSLRNVSRRFGSTQALHDLSLELEPGQVLAVTGPSGAGKTTLGRLISGLEQPDGGSVAIAGMRVDAVPARLRRVAHMFESYALYPTRTVAENIASPLLAPTSGGRFNAAERSRRIDEVLALTEMAHLRDRLPSQLSGGQKQRVALCRALVQDPSCFVLDEPIGHLDAKLRHSLRGEIRRRQRQRPQGTVWLTPDGVEALAVADRVAVLVDGELLQVGTPDDIVARPANVKVARLIGDPAMNILPVECLPGDAPRIRVGDAPPQVATPLLVQRLRNVGDGPLLLGLRPIGLRPLSVPEAHVDALRGEVYAVEPLGKHTILTASVAGQRVRAKVPTGASWRVGAPVALAFDARQVLAFDAATGALRLHESDH